MAASEFSISLEFRDAPCPRCGGAARLVINRALGVMAAGCKNCGWTGNSKIIGRSAHQEEPSNEQQ